MKVKDKWYPERELDVYSALLREMQNDMMAEGALERLQYELASTQEVLARFMCAFIKSPSQLNEVVGYNKYEEI